MTKRNSPVLVGAHVSVAGGVHMAFGRGLESGCAAMQIFTRNATRWEAAPLEPAEVARFRREQQRTRISPVIAHGSYLINLASPDPDLLGRSRRTLLDELGRAATLGLSGVVVHPGAHMGAGVEAGLVRVIASLDWVAQRSAPGAPPVCIENTAGQGTVLGGDFAHLGAIVRGVRRRAAVAVCVDTCHAHAAGYDLSNAAACRRTLAALDAEIGDVPVLALHLNDARGGRGSRLDRHEHIGRGRVGLPCFRFFVNEPRFARVPKIIETPKRLGEREMDPVNLGVLRRLARFAPQDRRPRRHPPVSGVGSSS